MMQHQRHLQQVFALIIGLAVLWTMAAPITSGVPELVGGVCANPGSCTGNLNTTCPRTGWTTICTQTYANDRNGVSGGGSCNGGAYLDCLNNSSCYNAWTNCYCILPPPGPKKS